MESYPRNDWGPFYRRFMANWRQGEHVSIVGPTGCGKTTCLAKIIPARDYVVVLVTKVHDTTIKRDFPGFERIERWSDRKAYQKKILLWPKPEKEMRATYTKQREVFQDALNEIFLDRNWCVVFDEQHYVCKQLGLEPENAMLQHQGRSSGLSIVNGTQRPAWVPLITFSGSTHNFLWRTTLDSDLKRLSDIGGIDRRELAQNMLQLDKHEFVYVDSRKGLAIRSQVER